MKARPRPGDIRGHPGAVDVHNLCSVVPYLGLGVNTLNGITIQLITYGSTPPPLPVAHAVDHKPLRPPRPMGVHHVDCLGQQLPPHVGFDLQSGHLKSGPPQVNIAAEFPESGISSKPSIAGAAVTAAAVLTHVEAVGVDDDDGAETMLAPSPFCLTTVLLAKPWSIMFSASTGKLTSRHSSPPWPLPPLH